MDLHHVDLMDAKHIPEVKSTRSGWTWTEYRLMCVVNMCESSYNSE